MYHHYLHCIKYLLLFILPLIFNACGGSSDSDTLLTSTNQPPRLTPLVPIVQKEGNSHSYRVEAYDEDGDSLIFTIVNQPHFVTLSKPQNNVLVLTLNPQNEDVGTYNNIVISVNDGTDTQSTTLSITIEATTPTPLYCSYYLDPINGSIHNDGNENAPWGTLSELFYESPTLAKGSVLCLLEGNHGSVTITNYHPLTPITIRAKPDHTATLTGLNIINSSNIDFIGLNIDGSNITPSSNPSNKTFLLNSDENSHTLNFHQLTIKSANDSSTWTQNDWYEKVHSGARFRGHHIRMTHSLVLNTYHALMFEGDYSYLAHTTIDNFAGDAIRGNGSFSTYEYNIVRDCYINDYAIQHDDAFQTFSLEADPKVEAVTLRYNKFLLFEDPITPFVINNNLIGNLMQGVIITDGYADSWIVENNLIVNDQPHGISLYGVRYSRIQNNTVIQHPNYSDTDVPRIFLAPSNKTGQQNFTNVIRNNITAQFTAWAYANDTVFEGNIELDRTDRESYLRTFEDYDNLDFHLKATANAVDAGVDAELSATDLDGNTRLNGAGVDVGAYEY